MNNVALCRAGVILGTLLLSACAEQGGPLTSELPTPTPLAKLAQLDCTVSTREKTLSCGSPSTAGDARSLIVGGQGTFVSLQASNHAYESSDRVYSFDVTVQNLIPQALGTTDGTTVDPAGVRVFFEQEPVPTGGATTPISILNATGSETFLRADQPYYQWDELLAPDQTSGPARWEFDVDSATTGFHFKVYVAAPVQFPDGWVDVSPGADTLTAGTAAGLTGSVRDVVGRVLADETITWGSTDAAVASVDAAGTLTALAPGVATITATSGVRTGRTTVAVCPNLEVGGVYTATMPLASSLCLAGGASGAAEYTYMPVNLSNASALALSVTASGIVPVTGPPSPAMMPGSGPSLLRQVDDRRMRTADDWHVRNLEEQNRQLRGLIGRPSARVNRAVRPTGARRVITPGVPAVGDLWSLNTASGCTGTRVDQTGRVTSVGQHIIIVADTMNPAGGFTTAQYDSIAAEFDSLAYNVNVDNFGAPTDLDGNGRVVAFYTRTVNQLSPPASGSVVSGYVNARDLFSSAADSCPLSNEGEIFYMLVPDPTGAVNQNVRTVSSVRAGTVGTLAHEFQHMINAARRIYVNGGAGFPETVWLNEGLSHVAEELMFYRASFGLAPRGNVDLSALTTGTFASRRVAAFNSYSNQNFGRLRSWLQRPDTTGPLRSSDVLATRGATWAFLRYAADRRNGNDAQFWYSLVNSQTSGTANLQAVLGSAPNDWVRDWVAAMYADDAVSGVSATYTQPSWNFRSVYAGLGGVPIGTRALSNGVALTLNYAAGGSTAYTRFAVPTGAFAGVSALSAGVAPTSPYALIVMRTK